MTDQKGRIVPFSVLLAYRNGVQLLAANMRLIGLMSISPFVVMLFTQFAIRLAGEHVGPFMIPVVVLPAGIVIGLLCSLLLRAMLLSEHPLASMPDDEHSDRRRHILSGAVAFALVQHVLMGANIMLVLISSELLKTPDQPAGMQGTLMMIVIFLMCVCARLFLLYVPLALGWSAQGFLKKLAVPFGNMRVIGLFMLNILSVSFLQFILINLLLVATDTQSLTELSGMTQFGIDVIAALSIVALSVMTTLSFAAATRQMTKDMVHENIRD